jgi:hypothetical protein
MKRALSIQQDTERNQQEEEEEEDDDSNNHSVAAPPDQLLDQLTSLQETSHPPPPLITKSTKITSPSIKSLSRDSFKPFSKSNTRATPPVDYGRKSPSPTLPTQSTSTAQGVPSISTSSVASTSSKPTIKAPAPQIKVAWPTALVRIEDVFKSVARTPEFCAVQLSQTLGAFLLPTSDPAAISEWLDRSTIPPKGRVTVLLKMRSAIGVNEAFGKFFVEQAEGMSTLESWLTSTVPTSKAKAAKANEASDPSAEENRDTEVKATILHLLRVSFSPTSFRPSTLRFMVYAT